MHATPAREGHPLRFSEIDAADLAAHADTIEAIYDARHTGIVVRGAFPAERTAATVARLGAADLADQWAAPNAGMTGGEIRTIGDAATPTFTALRGPSIERYGDNVAQHARRAEAVFGDADGPTPYVQHLLGTLFGGRPAAPPVFDDGFTWAPYNLRALDPGQQIYSHHDNHFGLEVYKRMPADLDRTTILSWFITLQAPDAGGELVVYGLWGSDPNLPMLPTRFIDTAALEANFAKENIELRAGDLVVFDAGRHVHRVAPIQGSRPRLTMGGFMTIDQARTRLAFWS
ncbi:MAG: 2OG-Fe(II) oxygenase [bacterium]